MASLPTPQTLKDRSAKTQIVKKISWPGRILSGLAIAFLTLDAAIKFMHSAQVEQAFRGIGMPFSYGPAIGTLLLMCVLFYALPQTAVFGAILLTGYLGGAVAMHVRVGDPLFSHILFPVYVGVLVWGGLFIREPRLRALAPLRK
jgi:DoxX-like family